MGPLKGIKVIEVGGIGPGPFCGMMLSDMGAEVIRVERKEQPASMQPKYHVMIRNRRSIGIDLKKAEGVDAVLKMVEQVDALQEGFRPGVMEKLGLLNNGNSKDKPSTFAKAEITSVSTRIMACCAGDGSGPRQPESVQVFHPSVSTHCAPLAGP